MRISYEKVYQVITSYYPQGIPASDSRYDKYPGILSVNELIKHADAGKWRKFVEKIAGQNKEILEDKVHWGLDGSAYFGRLMLLEIKMGDAVYKRQLNFHVSLLDPLYTVYGIDSIEVDTKGGLRVTFEPVVFISPLDIYNDWFKTIRREIEIEFSDSKFVPFSILNQKVPSVSVAGALVRLGDHPSVFQALFYGIDVTTYRYFGDVLYE